MAENGDRRHVGSDSPAGSGAYLAADTQRSRSKRSGRGGGTWSRDGTTRRVGRPEARYRDKETLGSGARRALAQRGQTTPADARTHETACSDKRIVSEGLS